MKEAIIGRLKKPYLGIWIGVAVALYISYYLVITVKKNYDMQQQIGTLTQQIDDLKVEQDKLKYQIQYYQTDAYKEKEARARLGLQSPGEGVVILPHSDETKTSQEDEKPKDRRSNYQQWIDFLMGRSS